MEERVSRAPSVYATAGVDHGDDVLEDFHKLNLNPNASTGPPVDACLDHLKSLFAFENLRTRVANYDGFTEYLGLTTRTTLPPTP